MVECTPEDEYNPDYEDDGNVVAKRHLGSIAAYSGNRGGRGGVAAQLSPNFNNEDEYTLKFKRFLGNSFFLFFIQCCIVWGNGLLGNN